MKLLKFMKTYFLADEDEQVHYSDILWLFGTWSFMVTVGITTFIIVN